MKRICRKNVEFIVFFKMICISHIRLNSSGEVESIQSNEEHLSGVANLAERFANEFGMGSWGRVLGLLHDKGKERKAFQDYIKKNSGYDSTIQYPTEHTHAFVGGVIAKSLYGKAATDLLCNQIVSHHTGLHDYYEMDGILNKEIPLGVNQSVEKIGLNKPPFALDLKDFNHLSRMLFSCLVDG